MKPTLTLYLAFIDTQLFGYWLCSAVQISIIFHSCSVELTYKITIYKHINKEVVAIKFII